MGRTVLLLSLLAAACSNRQGAGSADTPLLDSAAAGEVHVTLERTACFGSCPMYRLEIDGSGLVRYDGLGFVRQEGVDSATIDPAAVREIVEAAERLRFFELADGYRAGDPTCPEHFPDSPSVIASVTAKGRSKRVAADFGCVGVPQEIPELAAVIDRITESSRWTGR